MPGRQLGSPPDSRLPPGPASRRRMSAGPAFRRRLPAVPPRADRPLIAGDIAERADRGSEIGTRRCLARLVDQGIVIATEVGRYHVYRVNRMNLAAPIADPMGRLREELTRRLFASVQRSVDLVPGTAPLLGPVHGSVGVGQNHGGE